MKIQDATVIPEVINMLGDTLGTVESFHADSEGNIREVIVQLFSSEPAVEALTTPTDDEIAAILWKAAIGRREAMPVLSVLKNAGIVFRKVAG